MPMKQSPAQRLDCTRVLHLVDPCLQMLAIILRTSAPCRQKGRLAAFSQNVNMCGRAQSLRAGSYFRNFRNYFMVTQGEPQGAEDMRTVSSMAALGVEVEGASIR